VTGIFHPLRIALVAWALVVSAVLADSSPASAASCPTQTFLKFNHLAYVGRTVPATVPLSPGYSVGTGTVDHPASSNGCKRQTSSVQVHTAGSIDPHVAVFVSGRTRTAFVIGGSRCAGLDGPAYWDCLTKPLKFHGRQFTAISYPSTPAPRKTLALGAQLGKAVYHGNAVTIRRIDGVDPTLAVAISGQPSTAFVSPTTCPYSGFSNVPELDNLLRCLKGPVWFTFDPAASVAGGTVVARSDRPISSDVAGASISFVPVPVAADYLPPNHGKLDSVAHVADQVTVTVPSVPQGFYEAVVSCPACASRTGGATLFPAGSILVTPQPKSSPAIRIISYALAAAALVALFLVFRTRRSRTGILDALTSWLMGSKGGRGGSSRR
jgi:hypothetical protein